MTYVLVIIYLVGVVCTMAGMVMATFPSRIKLGATERIITSLLWPVSVPSSLVWACIYLYKHGSNYDQKGG